MRILWFAHRDILHPRAGGAERTTYEISRRLVTLGDEVMWASCWFPGAPSRSVIDGIQIRRTGGHLSSHLKVASLIRSWRPDTIVDDLGHVVPWFSEWADQTPGTVFFRHLHARTLPGQLTPVLALVFTLVEKQYRLIYRRSSFVTEAKQGVRDLVDIGIPSRRIVRIPPGVDLQRFRPAEKFPEPSMIYFGGFRDYKRPWIPVSIFKRLESRVPGLRLLMIGDGPSRRAVEMTAHRGGGARIHFVGRLGDSQLAEAISRAWLNIHTSTSEGWGLSILEAAAAGTPTVAFEVPGVSEAIESGVNGLTVPDGDIGLLGEAAERVLLSRDEWVGRSRLSAEPFTWELSADRWRTHLKNVADGAWGTIG